MVGHTLRDTKEEEGERRRATSHWCEAAASPEGAGNWAESAAREREVMIPLVMITYQVPYPQLCVVVWNVDRPSTMFYHQVPPLLRAT